MQAFELLRVDLPAEEAMLAAAAPPGLLEHARLQWAQRRKQADVRHTSPSELARGQNADMGLGLEYLVTWALTEGSVQFSIGSSGMLGRCK